MLKYISGVQEVYDKEVTRNPYKLKFVPDHFKTKKMCEKAVRMDSGSEQFRTLCGLLLPMPSIFFFSLIILRRKGCATRQLKKIHGG